MYEQKESGQFEVYFDILPIKEKGDKFRRRYVKKKKYKRRKMCKCMCLSMYLHYTLTELAIT